MFRNITLSEDDVPGAKFRLPNVEDHSVFELKRWLECRGLKRTGSKADLIKRCTNCINAGNADIIDVSVDKGKWFNLKLTAQTAPSGGNTSTAAISKIPTKWLPFPSVDIPQHFNKGHIYHYIIESVPNISTAQYCNTSDEEDADQSSTGTEKSFRRGQQYVISNHVVDLFDCKIDEQYHLKAKVKSSFRDKKYDVAVVISYHSGTIVRGTCHCKQSALGRCSHVSALLLLLEKHVNTNGYTALSCTSKPCQWGQGSQKKIPQQVHIATYQHVHSRTNRAEYDPRPLAFRQAEASVLEHNNFLAALENANDVPSLWQKILKYKYEDFNYNEDQIISLKRNIEQFVRNLESYVSHCKDSAMMVEGTELQSSSDAWHRWRAILITSSIAKKVIGLTESSAKINFFKSHLWNLEKLQTPQMKYGLLNESKAREFYVEVIRSTQDLDATVTTTGLWISKKYPFFGCSPDGIVRISNNVGLLEIKCPKILEHIEPQDFNKCLTTTQKLNFCLKFENGQIVLKTNHTYYSQVQLSMGIMGYPWCDFVVWSPKGMIIIKILFNELFFNDVVQKLKTFYNSVFVPEYFVMRTPRNLVPFEL